MPIVPPAPAWGIRPVALTFYLLAAATLIGFNSLSNMVIDTGWHVTLGLALGCIFLCAVVRIPFGHSLGSPGAFLLAALFSYLWIGGSVAALTAGTDGALRSVLGGIITRRVVLAMLLIVAVALGAAATMRRVGAERLLLVVLHVQVVSCIAMLMTPFLAEHVYALSPRLEHVAEHATHRFLGTFVNPNQAGTVGCLGVATALAFLTCGRHTKFAALALVLALTATVLTFSRGAMLALVALCALSFPMLVQLAFRHVVVLVVIAAAAAAAAMAVVPYATADQLNRLDVQFAWSDMRLEWLWPLTLSQIAEAPLLGHGITPHHAVVATDRCTASSWCGPHNVYLMLWREAGVVPFALFVLFFVAMLHGGLKAPKSPARNAAVGWTVVVAVACLLGHSVYATHLAFIMGCACALLCAARKAPSPSAP